MDGNKLATRSNAMVMLNWRSRAWLVRRCAMAVPKTAQVQVAQMVTVAKTTSKIVTSAPTFSAVDVKAVTELIITVIDLGLIS